MLHNHFDCPESHRQSILGHLVRSSSVFRVLLGYWCADSQARDAQRNFMAKGCGLGWYHRFYDRVATTGAWALSGLARLEQSEFLFPNWKWRTYALDRWRSDHLRMADAGAFNSFVCCTGRKRGNAGAIVRRKTCGQVRRLECRPRPSGLLTTSMRHVAKDPQTEGTPTRIADHPERNEVTTMIHIKKTRSSGRVLTTDQLFPADPWHIEGNIPTRNFPSHSDASTSDIRKNQKPATAQCRRRPC